MPTPGSFVLALQLQGSAASTRAASGGVVELVTRGQPALPGGACHSAALFGRLVGHRRPEAGRSAGSSGRRRRSLDVFRPQHQVLGGAGGLQVAGGQSPGRHVPGGLRRAEAAAPAVSTTGSPGAAAPRPTLKSLAAVDRALLRASSAEVNKLEKRVPFLATTASITPFIGLFGTVWGIMSAFSEHRRAGLDRSRGRRAGHCRSAHRDGGGSVRRHPRRLLLQPLHDQGEDLRVGDGRLRARVPEHRRKELHLDAEGSCRCRKRAAADAGAGGACRPRCPRSTSFRWWT